MPLHDNTVTFGPAEDYAYQDPYMVRAAGTSKPKPKMIQRIPVKHVTLGELGYLYRHQQFAGSYEISATGDAVGWEPWWMLDGQLMRSLANLISVKFYDTYHRFEDVDAAKDFVRSIALSKGNPNIPDPTSMPRVTHRSTTRADAILRKMGQLA